MTDTTGWFLTFLYGAACFTAGAWAISAWRNAGQRLAAIQEEFRPPAAGTPSPRAATGESLPLPAPLPGPALGQAASPPPAPGKQACGAVAAGVGFNRAGCMFAWDRHTGLWVHTTCREPFNTAEWEERLHG